MVWWVEPLEIAEKGVGIGKYRLVANSDEGGGIHGLCGHKHDTKEEATNCAEAIAQAPLITGVPNVPTDGSREHVFDAETFQMLCDSAKAGNLSEVTRILGVEG